MNLFKNVWSAVSSVVEELRSLAETLRQVNDHVRVRTGIDEEVHALEDLSGTNGKVSKRKRVEVVE